MKSFLLFLFSFFVFTLTVHAQSTELRGSVYDKKTGEVLIGASVQLSGSNKGVSSDVNGYFSINHLIPGSYWVKCKYLGYQSDSQEIVIKAGQKHSLNFYLSVAKIEIGEANVTAKKQDKKSKVLISKIEIKPEQIGKIPSVGGVADLAQYLQIIPGVIFTGDQGGQLYIRGGSPIQNKVLLDGMTIYNPFHSIGLFSVFDVDIIKKVDVYTAGFNAEYGGRVSAIMDITTKDGNKSQLSGNATVSPFLSKISIEGPIKKFSESKGGSSYLFSYRNSYLRQTSPMLYAYAGKNGLPYNFSDLYGKLSFYAPGGTKINFFGFNFNDDVKYPGSTSYHWDAQGLGTKLFGIPNSSSTVIDANFAYSSYKITQKETDNKPRFSDINGFESGLDFTYYSGVNFIKYGLDINGFKTNFSFWNVAKRLVEQTDFTTEIAGYVRANEVAGRFVFDPSLRFQFYASLQEPSFEPRFALKYVVRDNFRLKAATGLYSQNLLSAQSDKDVVNLFYGFLSGPEDLPGTFNGKDVNSRLQKARHVVGGFEYDPGKNININVEGYLKDFNQLTNINRNKIFDDIPEFKDKPESLRADYIIEKGKAYGADMLITYDVKPFYFWFAFSHGYVTRFDGTTTYYTHWDRRNNLNLVASYAFGKDKTWEISSRFNYGSGFPFTKTQGFYELLDFQKGISTDYTTQNGRLGIIYGAYNDGRLSDFHRLDMSLQKTKTFSDKRSIKFVLNVTNVYNRQNVFYFDRVTYTRVNQLPILPAASVSYKF